MGTAPVAGSVYFIVDLGDPAGLFAQARAINEHGQVGGVSLLSVAGIEAQRAVTWHAGGFSDLGTLGGLNSRAVDINSQGTIAGWAQDGGGYARPVLWQGATVVELPTLGGNQGAAWGLNDAGLAVGNAESGAGNFHATLWSNGGVKDLGTLGGSYSVAYDINSSGIVVGSALDTAERERAVVWEGDAPVDLGALSAGHWTTARGINDQGQIILWGKPADAPANRAALWSGDFQDPVIALGTFGGTESWAYGLNNHGFVVGWAGREDETYHAFVWDGATLTDLGTLGGLYSSAYDINDQGVIVGFAQDAAGVTRAVAWVPVPEPGRLTLLALGMFALWVTRRRQP
jgi:probable HAF family extracellular repeat protein